MATTSIDHALEDLMKLRGAVGCALVDYSSGMSLGSVGGGNLDLDLAAAGNAEVVRAELKAMEAIRSRSRIEDILITLGDQYHLIRLLSREKNLFFYLVLRREDSNLAIARHKLNEVEELVTV